MDPRPLLSLETDSEAKVVVNEKGERAKVQLDSVRVSLECGDAQVDVLQAHLHDDGKVRSVLARETRSSEKTCKVGVGAELQMGASDVDQLVEAVREASFNFESFLLNYRSYSDTLKGHHAENQEKRTHAEFARQISAVLGESLPADGNLFSSPILADFTSASALLDKGVEHYIAAVRKVLQTDLDTAVSVSFTNLSYRGQRPKIMDEYGYETVARSMKRTFCGCCIFAARTIRNLVQGRKAIEWEETPILKNLNGFIKPGRLTLVLAPPGAGKTSFLRVIAGKTLGPSDHSPTETVGSLRYNDRDVGSLENLPAWVSFAAQSDEHQPLLTVRETLDFAYRCTKQAYYNDPAVLERIREQSGEAGVGRAKALERIEVDIAMALLGLTRCADTVIGDENLKGVSGGERRRVTLGEMLVTGSQIMCCDEISTGLDSAATYDIVAYLRAAAHALQKTIIVALLQPAPEVIELFDDLIVMAEGHIIFHGPRENVSGYFESLGFVREEGKDLGDFLVEVPTRNGRNMHLPAPELAARGLPPPPETALEFARRWEQSDLFKKEMADLSVSACETRSKAFDFDQVRKRPYLQALKDTASWCMLLRLRDKTQIIARVVVMLGLGLFQGSFYYNLPLKDTGNRSQLLLTSLMMLGLLAIPMCQTICKQRAIFYKHIDAQFYSASQFSLAHWAVFVPFTIFDVIAFGAVVYWLVGMAQDLDRFLVFLAVCITFGLAMNTITMSLPFHSTDASSAVVACVFVLIMSILSSGAMTVYSKIPAFLRWVTWINPLAWSFRALAINEYHADAYDIGPPCPVFVAGFTIPIPQNCQKYYLELQEIWPEEAWVLGGILFNCGIVLVFLFAIWAGLKYRRHGMQTAGASSDALMVNPPAQSVRTEDENEKYLFAVSPRGRESANALSPGNSPTQGASRQLNAAVVDMSHFGAPVPLQRQNSFAMVQTAPKTLIIKDLWYTIPINGEPIDFLKGVSFYAQPGRMMALMGSSGAGKTTLMDCIAGRKTVGYARGQILVNGKPKVQHQFVKYTGYVEQFGVHADCATVRESLEFSATLRLPSASGKETICTYVNSVLDLLELYEIQGELAGTLSMEQNKRLTLGVELVANPSIVFCDEPTSGLDARAAAIVMRVMLKVARSGRTVVATIHQPSTVIFNFFDDLLLLKRGGEVVYFGELGERSAEMIKYLQGIPGTPPCPHGFNPATWMLEVIGAGTADAESDGEAAKKDYAAMYKHSSLCRAQAGAIENLIEQFNSYIEPGSLASDSAEPRLAQSDFASPVGRNFTDLTKQAELDKSASQRTWVRGQLTQTRLLLWRNFETYWRSPQFSYNRLGVITCFTLLFSAFFYGNELHDMQDVINRLMAIMFFNTLSTIYNVIVLIPFALRSRALYYRERNTNMYSVVAFNMAEGLVEVPWILVQVGVTVPLIYFLTNLNTDDTEPFFFFFSVCFLLIYLMTTVSLLSASLFGDAMTALMAAIAFIIPLSAFSGLVPPKEQIPGVFLPIYYVSFFRFANEAVLTTQFHGDHSIVCLPEGKPWDSEFSETIAKVMLGNITKGICTKTGTFDMAHPLESLKNISGIQMDAERLMLEEIVDGFRFENRWMDITLMAVWIVGLRLLTIVASTFINHQKR